MKYKVNDIVKIVKSFLDKDRGAIGQVVTIDWVDPYDDERYTIKEKLSNKFWFASELELVSKQFTKSDLKDNHIVVTRNNGKRIWSTCAKSYYKNNLLYDGYSEQDIVEVWEFDKLVWKREEKPIEILDKGEKKWLRNFIRSTQINVECIKKCRKDTGRYFLSFHLVGEFGFVLPDLKNKNFYKNMILEKEYTLKELGLDKEEK